MSTHNQPLVNITLPHGAPLVAGAQAAPQRLDLDALRAKLATQSGPYLWKSLEQVAETPDFQEWATHEFGVGEDDQSGSWVDPVSRRRLLSLLGASLGLAGLTACTRQPEEKIIPYVTPPEEIVPGKPLFFATSLIHGGYAKGVLVESHMGRPTKIEGNADHPSSLGSTDVYSQGAVLCLYDPDRSQTVTHNGRPSSWQSFTAAMRAEREKIAIDKGAGLRILTENTTSPTFAALMQKTLAEFPGAKWHQYDSAGRDSVHAGARLAFGRDVNTVYDLTKANVILSLDSDFLAFGPGSVRYARDFASRRSAEEGNTMNRLYVAESCPTSTGSIADHRLPLASGDIDGLARAIAGAVGVAGVAGTSKAPSAWVAAVAADLKANAGSCAVIAGDYQPAAVHAVAHAINLALGNAGKTVLYTDPIEASTMDGNASLKALVADMNAGKVSVLVTIGSNPVYTAPGDLNFVAALAKVPLKIHHGAYDDETAALCEWHIHEAYSLETWGDARSFETTAGIVQPLIAPLYEGRTSLEMMAALQGRPEMTPYQLVREYWTGWHAEQKIAQPFEEFWRKSVHDGVIAGSALAPVTVALQSGFTLPPATAAGTLEVNFRPDPTVFDGRFANNGWMQELPKPVTKLTWDNAVWMSPAMAQKMSLQNGDVVELKSGSRSVRGPVWLTPGHADTAVTVHLGYGRTRMGRLANQVGFQANAVRSGEAPYIASNIQITKTGDWFQLFSTQEHHSMEGRDIIRVGTAAAYKQNEKLFEAEVEPGTANTIYPPEHKYEGNSWGMSIDLNACTGCNACTIACVAENNTPVVGKEQVGMGREMHWIRVDRYFEGGLDSPDAIYHQPLMCQHCDQAPCENVCPVAATVHSTEGLNQMVYNRCIGTRYCSNNCPYKVRRFNFFLYSDWDTESLQGARNPNVSVRSRGVMEKCSYCVQRINSARIEAEKENRPIRDGEVITACQSACPTRAIHFGNMNDPDSKIAALKKNPRSYGLLDSELNTLPRTSYLAKLRNPNPALEPAAPARAEREG
jgi:molybdopterin-containing oxidoreductase family iron-sulfur binding subunit